MIEIEKEKLVQIDNNLTRLLSRASQQEEEARYLTDAGPIRRLLVARASQKAVDGLLCAIPWLVGLISLEVTALLAVIALIVAHLIP